MQIIMLPAENITIGQRQRSLDEATKAHISALAADIKSNGLIHAVTVNRDHELTAGFCRLNAIMELNAPYKYASSDIAPGFVPCVVTHLTSEAELFRIELMENLRRKNLTPVDEARAISKLHVLLKTQHGETWSEAQTGAELDSVRGVERSTEKSRAAVADSLIINQYSDDPDIAAASSRAEAAKLARKKLEKEFRSALGAMQVPTESSDFQVIAGSCLDILRTFSHSSFAGIVTDPPYGVDAHTFGEQTGASFHDYQDDAATADAIADSIFTQGFSATKFGGHLYMFCSITRWSHLTARAALAGWTVFSSPLIWDKVNIGHMPWPGYFQRRYECILFARKGDRPLNKIRSDVLSFAATKDKLHSAEKPIDLLVELIGLSFYPGDTILDPCCGSGTIFPAAHAHKVKAVGIELNPEFVNISRARIAELK